MADDAGSQWRPGTRPCSRRSATCVLADEAVRHLERAASSTRAGKFRPGSGFRATTPRRWLRWRASCGSRLPRGFARRRILQQRPACSKPWEWARDSSDLMTVCSHGRCREPFPCRLSRRSRCGDPGGDFGANRQPSPKARRALESARVELAGFAGRCARDPFAHDLRRRQRSRVDDPEVEVRAMSSCRRRNTMSA